MNAGQYEGIVGRLDAILSKMPTAPAPVRTGRLYERYGPAPVPTGRPTLGVTRNEQEAGSFFALVAMLKMLDSWIDGARENHEALDHRHENTGEECWRTFAPNDIRRMVNDVAQELGLAEFPAPTAPEEDKAL